MKKLIILSVCLLFALTLLNSGDFKYVGFKKCKMCHKGERKGNVFETWVKKKHATAFESVKKKGEENNPKCMPCHTTGFEDGGYKIGDVNAPKFEGVQCEACHGPGSIYKKTKMMKDKKLALQNGLVDINEKTCSGCHDPKKCDHVKAFNYKEALKAIDHKYTKK
jgi:hypothetical protein